jgi:4-amino-4-deoxychorismate lyase
MAVHPAPVHPPEIKRQGVKARLCGLRLGLNPVLAGIKHLNRLEQVMARTEWDDDGIREGLLLDYEGFLVEGVMSNVFLVSSGRLRTPLLDRCGVSGVMRGLVFDAARELGVAAEEARISFDEACRAEELFLTNSVIGLWPVSSLEGRTLPVGPLCRRLARRIDAWAEAELITP